MVVERNELNPRAARVREVLVTYDLVLVQDPLELLADDLDWRLQGASEEKVILTGVAQFRTVIASVFGRWTVPYDWSGLMIKED